MPSKTDYDRVLRDRLCGWIRHEMDKSQRSQNDIAREMGMRSGTLSRYMTGDEIPSCGFVLRAAKALHEVSLSALIFKDPEARYLQQRAPPPRSPRPASAPSAQTRKQETSAGAFHRR